MESYARAKRAVEDKNRELNSCSNEIKELELQREQHTKVRKLNQSNVFSQSLITKGCAILYLQDAKKATNDLRKVKDDLSQWEKNSTEAKRTVADLQKKNPWILEEKRMLGYPHLPKSR